MHDEALSPFQPLTENDLNAHVTLGGLLGKAIGQLTLASSCRLRLGSRVPFYFLPLEKLLVLDSGVERKHVSFTR